MVEDLTGRCFGLLTVIKQVENRGNRTAWLCKCDCGNFTTVEAVHLKSGHTKSCGCLLQKSRKTIKGLSHHPLYQVWKAMKQRCYNPKASRYERYGGRGITVCDNWKNDFLAFYEDMKDGYKPGVQLDRIDNNKGYCKENCQWVTPAENVKKRGNTIMYKGKCLKDYCTEHGLKYNTVMGRIKQYGWNIEDACRPGNFKGQRRNKK